VTEQDRAENLRMIRESAGGLAPRTGDFHRVRGVRKTTSGMDRDVWRQMADLGWLAMRLPEEDGGLGLGVDGVCVIAQELGASLAPEPFGVVSATVPLLPLGWRERVLAGDAVVLPAWQETPNSLDVGKAVTFRDGRMSGRKILVPSAGAADAFLVSTGAGLVLIEANAAGLTISTRETQDGGHFGVLTFDNVEAESVEGDLEDALDDMTLAHCAYMLGAAERAFDMTLAYLSVRKQFGRLIGSFQVLQHRAVDIKIQLELGRAVLDEAIAAAVAGVPRDERRMAASRAKARISDLAMLISRESIQMHGAIGVTEEHDIGLFCRKALTLFNQFGAARLHRDRYLRLAGALEAA